MNRTKALQLLIAIAGVMVAFLGWIAWVWFTTDPDEALREAVEREGIVCARETSEGFTVGIGEEECLKERAPAK